MRVLVTGASGFVGPHLCRALERAGHQVTPCAGPSDGGILDVRCSQAVFDVVREEVPDAVVHLAGWAAVGASFAAPLDCVEVNVLGTAHLLEGLRRHASAARLLLVSSGEVYGPGPALPRREEDPTQPRSPYATSKLMAEALALEYHRSFHLDVVVARAFNHVGPGQDERFVIPSFVRQLRELPPSGGVIRVGNLQAVRDFTSVFDTVAAYELLLRKADGGSVVNVSSGQGISIAAALERLCELVGVRVETEVDPARQRPSDIPHLVGDNRRLLALGFEPRRDPFADALLSFERAK